MAKKEQNNNLDDIYHKPTFDGRINYHLIIKQHLELISRCIVSRDYNVWFSALSSTYALVSPFVKNPEEIKLELNKIERTISVSNTLNNNILTKQITTILNKQLQDTTEKIYNSSKDLFLTTKSEEFSDEFDVDKWMRESEV